MDDKGGQNVDHALNITESDLLAELEVMLDHPAEEGGWRVEELAEALGRGPTTIYRYLRRLEKAGKLERGEKWITGLNGRRRMRVRTYLLRGEEDA